MLISKLHNTIIISLTQMVLPPAFTQAEDSITIEDGSITTAIKNRIPQKTAQG